MKILPECSVLGCTRNADCAKEGAVCAAHRQMNYRRGTYVSTRTNNNSIPVCTITGCNERFRSRGMCNRHLTRGNTYGLSAIQLDMLYARGKCDSCGVDGDFTSLHIDHDHACCVGFKTCGKCTRGLLCMGCNVGLGAFGDSPERLRMAALYLEDKSAT